MNGKVRTKPLAKQSTWGRLRNYRTRREYANWVNENSTGPGRCRWIIPSTNFTAPR